MQVRESCPVRASALILFLGACTAAAAGEAAPGRSQASAVETFTLNGLGCQVYADDMESGASGWTHSTRGDIATKAQIADPPGPSTWHLASTTCRDGALGSTMFVSNGNDGPGCTPDSSRDHSQLLSPPIALPASGNLSLEFDALSHDEAGTCLGSGSFDKHDVGLTVDGGATYTPLNDCTALTDGVGTPAHHAFDISAWAGQTVQVIFVYDTVDERTGHVFAVDNVAISADACGDVVLSAGKPAVTHAWQTVVLPHSYANPVLIAGPASRNGADPGVIRLRNVGGAEFQARYQEWDYLDGAHYVPEDFSYLVLPAGRHVMPDGSIWEAGTFDHSGTGAFMRVNFSDSFPATPTVFLTAQTANGSQPVTVRATGLTRSSFRAALFEEEALMDGHVTETVGYLAVYSAPRWGEVTVGGAVVPYLLQQLGVDQRFTPVLSWNLKVEEEASDDTETVHGEETVGVLALGGHLFAQDVGLADSDTMTLRRIDADGATGMEWGMLRDVTHRQLRVPLARSYANPVVIVKPVSARGPSPGVLRLADVRSDSFRVRYQEWDYLDDVHDAERLFYMVVESGVQTIGTAGGTLTVEAGTLSSSKTSRFGGWHTIDFSAGFATPPAVFSAVQTTAGTDAVTTRNRHRSAQSFELTMQEEDGGDQLHFKTESVGWVAIQPGNGQTANGRKFRVLEAGVGDVPVEVFFGASFGRRFPSVVADIGSRFGADACFLRYSAINNSSITLFVQEEQSADEETLHLVEDVGVFAAE